MRQLGTLVASSLVLLACNAVLGLDQVNRKSDDTDTGGNGNVAGNVSTAGGSGGGSTKGGTGNGGGSGARQGGTVGAGGTASNTGGVSVDDAGAGGMNDAGTGGTASGGSSSGGNANGGTNAGGSAAGGKGGSTSSGGAATGGSSAGGKASTGGTNAGGTSTGGASTGGKASTGGTSTGGTSTGGASTGGKASTGGTSTGGTSTGGTSTGGTSTGGTSTGGAPCLTPPAADPVVGWASVDGMGQNGTTGGGNATPQVVTTLAAFTTAVSGTAAGVVYLNAVLPPTSVAIGSNKTIVGVCGAEFHGHLELGGSTNVVVRNLKIVGYAVGDCSKDPAFDSTVGCSSGSDAVTLSAASHHIWFDHCDVSDGTDGNLDVVAGSDFVTISWTKFHYSPRTDNVGNDSTGAGGHRYSNLIGANDTAPADVGHLNVTLHHNWWADNIDQRIPRTRRGKIHVVNNLYTSAGNTACTNAGFESHLLVENNIYNGVKNPLVPDAAGDMLARNNVFTNTTGTTAATGTGFTPPYAYTPEATGSLAAAIMAGAGPH